ncbi:MAG: hypothetical protein JWM68_5375 [Verrucomicrobiales bacterium]|nr:hypothetical protein [Verrucomicrobiales bacterium]
MHIVNHNRKAWDGLVERANRWTVPVSSEVIQAARAGKWSILLTPQKAIPAEWFPPLKDLEVLCLAGGGGQQGPVLAAAGAKVTVFDNSPKQLAQDRTVADRDGLSLKTVVGDMADLSCFAEGAFDLVVHPCSNSYVPAVRPVWQEIHRVLRRGGILLAGFVNPACYIFDETLANKGELKVRHALPYSDITNLTEEEQMRLLNEGEPFCFSHSLTELIGGQIEAGLVLTSMYEDNWPEQILSKYMPGYIATRALKSKENLAGETEATVLSPDKLK